MSRKNKNRQPTKTKPKAPKIVNKKDYSSIMIFELNKFINTRGIIVEDVGSNVFTFFKDDEDYSETFKEELIEEVSKSHNIELKDYEDYFKLIFKG